MTGYRLYFLQPNGRIAEAAEFLAEGDLEARLAAQERSDGRAMELWSGRRKVAEIPPEDATPDA